jgi:hypothetical protein
MSENSKETSENLEKLNSRIFTENLHTKCKVQAGPADTIQLELIEVGERPTSPRMECFSVLFQGPASPVLPQRIWKLEHPRLGTFSLFLTPLGVNESGATYEAVFHRHRKQDS